MSVSSASFGEGLRAWRLRRRLSQLDLAGEAEVSSRHLSFIETGRSAPSREMVLRLAERLDVPIRERNVLLVAAGFAPVFPEASLAAPEMAAARAAVGVVLAAARPYPAFALDRHWNVAATNGALPELLEGIDESLRAPPLNVIRVSLHPKGLAPRILNLADWRAHMLARLARQIELTADPALIALMDEARGYGGALPAARTASKAPPGTHEPMIPLRVRLPAGDLAFLSTTLVFGASLEVTLSELMVESFFPADTATDALVRKLASLPPR